MLSDILNKHVSLSMKNGDMVEGYVKELREGFIKMVESTNTEVIAREEDVSVVRVVTASAPHAGESNGMPSKAPVVMRNQDFSIPSPRSSDFNAPHSSPSFVRSTDK